jgi:hypothetical protein
MDLTEHKSFGHDRAFQQAPERRNYRAKSARRLRHEAEGHVFTLESGGLEGIRQRLGLRASEICEILKVHPSAWIRWNTTGKVPPHILQMLEWYLELQELRSANPRPALSPLNVQGRPTRRSRLAAVLLTSAALQLIAVFCLVWLIHASHR